MLMGRWSCSPVKRYFQKSIIFAMMFSNGNDLTCLDHKKEETNTSKAKLNVEPFIFSLQLAIWAASLKVCSGTTPVLHCLIWYYYQYFKPYSG